MARQFKVLTLAVRVFATDSHPACEVWKEDLLVTALPAGFADGYNPTV